MSLISSYISATYRVLSDRVKEFWTEGDTTTTHRIFEHPGTYNTYTTFFLCPTHIIDNIYLGSAFNAANYSQLSELDIKIIINMTNEVSNHFENNFEYKKIHIYDNGSDDIETHLENTYKFISDNNDKNIFVHCKMGASRSVSIVLYYIMRKHNKSLDYAINFIKEKRPIINPNCGFVDTLKKYDTPVII